MKTVSSILRIFFLCLLVVQAGCEPGPAAVKPPAKADNLPDASTRTRYTPVQIDIMPLTEINSTNNEEGPKINVYVSLLDPFGCQIKSPGTFRFELYERVPHSGEPKGKRIVIWPSIDLTGAVENNNYWRDFLRAYEFNLDFEPQANRTFILQATCLCPSGKRLSAEAVLKSTQ